MTALRPRTRLWDTCKRAADGVNRAAFSVDRLVVPQSVRERPDAPLLFVLGVPRSGTTLAFELVAAGLDVAYFTAAMDYLYGMPNTLAWVTKKKLPKHRAKFISDRGKIPGLWAPAEVASFWHRWLPWDGEDGHYVTPEALGDERTAELSKTVGLLSRIHQKPVVFKCVYLTLAIRVLVQAFPSAYFLYVRRDPLMNFQSLYLARKQSGEHRWWSVRPPGYREWLDQPLWKQVFEQIAQTRTIAERDLRACADGRFMEIDYELICNSPMQVLEQLQELVRSSALRRNPSRAIPQRFPCSQAWRLSAEMKAQLSGMFEQRGLTCGAY